MESRPRKLHGCHHSSLGYVRFWVHRVRRCLKTAAFHSRFGLHWLCCARVFLATRTCRIMSSIKVTPQKRNLLPQSESDVKRPKADRQRDTTLSDRVQQRTRGSFKGWGPELTDGVKVDGCTLRERLMRDPRNASAMPCRSFFEGSWSYHGFGTAVSR